MARSVMARTSSPHPHSSASSSMTSSWMSVESTSSTTRRWARRSRPSGCRAMSRRWVGGGLTEVLPQARRGRRPVTRNSYAVDGIAGQPHDAVDVAPGSLDAAGDAADLGRAERPLQLVSQDGHRVGAARRRGGRWRGIESHRQRPVLGEVLEDDGQGSPVRLGDGQCGGQGQMSPHQHLFEVGDRHGLQFEQVHQVGGDPGMVGAGDPQHHRVGAVGGRLPGCGRTLGAGFGRCAHGRYGTAPQPSARTPMAADENSTRGTVSWEWSTWIRREPRCGSCRLTDRSDSTRCRSTWRSSSTRRWRRSAADNPAGSSS